MANQMVRVKREILESCMTCPLCNKLLKEATTISLCLHTFCRKCIYEKLSSDEVDSCPVCDVDLGCLPVEKLRSINYGCIKEATLKMELVIADLSFGDPIFFSESAFKPNICNESGSFGANPRPDHNLQDIRAKIFPLKKRKINPPEVSPSISLPVKRKERSLSSLVVNTPEVLMQTGLTGRRSRLNGRKSAALRACSFGIEEPPKKEDYSGEDHLLSSSSPESSNKLARIKRQDSSLADPSKSPRRKQDTDDGEFMEGKADLWTPLNCLVEAANRTKSSKSYSQGHTLFKSEPSNAPDSKLDTSETKGKPGSPRARDTVLYIPKTKNKGYGQKSKGNNKNKGTASFVNPMKRKRLCGANRNKAASSMEVCPPTRGEHNGSTAKVCRQNNPIWFSLVASADMEGDVSLPQISACYLRIKDGQMPVSFIQKYLVKKLDLMNEAEVEITCRGRPALPNMQLQSLVDLWVRSASTTKKIPALVGSTAKDFVMVLSYSRKPPIP